MSEVAIESVRASLLDPFIEATGTTLREMAGVEAVPCADPGPADARTRWDITSVVGLTTAAGGGALAVGFPRAAAAALAERMLAAVPVAIDDGMIADCAGELVNVIAGQAKALLHGTQYAFRHGTPTALAGPDRPIPCDPGASGFRIPFVCEVGEFEVFVAVPL